MEHNARPAPCTCHSRCRSRAEPGSHLAGLEHGQPRGPRGGAAEQLGGEGCVCDLHAFLQSLQKSIAGGLQQRPHIDSLLRNNQMGDSFTLPRKKTPTCGMSLEVSIHNVITIMFPPMLLNKYIYI